MKACSLWIRCGLLVAGALCLRQARAEEIWIIPPDSSGWEEVYDPAYRRPTELPVGTALRKELFEKLRAKASPKTLFEGSLKAYRNWALFTGRTVDDSGRSITHPPLDNDDAAALWLRTQEGWVLVAHSFGHGDAFYLVWHEQYGAPRELVGLK